jgi:hypothetical protein
MRTIALALALASAACAETSPLYYGHRHDAGTAAAPDASSLIPDAAGARVDAGHLPPDAGRIPPDAGRPCVACVPGCANAACGSDGCGGSCGVCAEGLTCAEHFNGASCVIVDVPWCGGRECGGDGLGGLCGVCPASWQCGLDALCQPAGGGCGPVGAGGICIGGFLVTCQGGSLVHSRCQFDACEVDAAGHAACKPPPCIPDCFGMACSDDGCGGSCGDCAADEQCSVMPTSHQGICLPPGPLPDLRPTCTGGSLITWQSPTSATVTDCLSRGFVCDDSCDPVACRPPGKATPCGAVPAAGHCAGDVLFECVGGVVAVRHCRDWGYSTCERVGMEKFGCGW